MDKYEVTRCIQKAKDWLNDPSSTVFDFPFEIYKEIMEMPTDKDGYVPIYYLSDELKTTIKVLFKDTN